MVDATDPPLPPPDAAELLGDGLMVLERYARLLAGPGVERGLLGPRETPRLWDRHLLNSAVLAPLPPDGGQCADLGSGAGLPGLVVALLRPDVRMTLLEPLLRRARFLTEAVEHLGVGDRVTVLRIRAQKGDRSAYDTVFARAVAPLERLVEWGLPLVRPGGELVAVKGARAAAELDQAAEALARLGARSWTVERLGTTVLEVPTTVVRVRAGRPPYAATSRSPSGRT